MRTNIVLDDVLVEFDGLALLAGLQHHWLADQYGIALKRVRAGRFGRGDEWSILLSTITS